MRKYYLSISIILFSFLFSPVYAEIMANSGFIPGEIWYSKETLMEGDTVNIYTAVWNGEKNPISTKIEFYDKNVILGSRDITVPSLTLKDVYIPWKITSGDHVISAKIISSTTTISGKTQKIVLDRNATSSDKQTVSVIVKNADGQSVSSSDVIKNKISETSSEISEIIPEKVSSSVSGGIDSLDNFRTESFVKVSEAKDTAKDKLIKIEEQEKKSITTSSDKKDIQEAVKKPVTYVKIFLLSVLAFILDNKIAFYGVLIIIAFYILRFIYFKIRHR